MSRHDHGVLLAIESSCDETAAAVLDRREILSNVVASQAELHTPYGGVVPEVAARHHLTTINAVIDRALDDAGRTLDSIDAVAVTERPGLIGALLVGVATAKGLAWSRGLPLIPVDHLRGHIHATWLAPLALDPPYVSLVASGGHTRLDRVSADGEVTLLGETLDDAAGEAIDKGARMLGLGYPGGAALDRLAADGDRDAYEFPVGLAGRDTLDFSFAGVKTALLYLLRDIGTPGPRAADVAASYQEAVMRPLAERLLRAAEKAGARALSIGGGVAANSRLRALVTEGAEAAGIRVAIPPISLCTDNAAMIGAAAYFTDRVPWPGYLAQDAVATAPPGGVAT